MKNEKGITLVELLVAVVIAGLVLVPLLTTMTGTFSRTIEQGKNTQLAYFGQEVMEIIREQGYQADVSPTAYVCEKNKGCVVSTAAASGTTYDAKATISAEPKTFSEIPFYEITVAVVSLQNPADQHELVTVVKEL